MTDIAIIDELDKAKRILRHVGDSRRFHALDFETTGLDPKEGAEVAVISIHGPAWSGVIDLFAIGEPLKALKEELEPVNWVVFNSKFEYRFFWEQGIDVALHDALYLRAAVLGGDPKLRSLKAVVYRDLKIEIDKELQVSDWAADELTDEQYQYALDDSVVTYKLWEYWLAKATDEQREGYNMFNGMVPAVIEMEDSGMTLDIKYHKKLVAMWERRRAVAEHYLRRMVSEEEIPNLNSNKQMSNFLKSILDEPSINNWEKTEKSGDLKMKREILTKVSRFAPYPLSRWLAAYCVYQRAGKYLSSFGENLIHSAQIGRANRFHPRFNIAAARTGRFSSSGPNAQNMPKSATFRRSIVAGMGRVLVGGDLSGIEVRVLAALASDEVLWHDQVYGDVHREVASFMFDKPVDKISKTERGRAKALTFLICYGGGAAAVSGRYGVSMDEAQGFIDSWGERYPKAMDFRNIQFERAQRRGDLRTACGRTIWVTRRASLPVCANYPVQGSALDVMAHTINHLHDYLETDRELGKVSPMTRLLATVHDEIIIETTKDSAETCEGMLKTAFENGWADMFPGTSVENLYETGIGKNWAEIH